MKYCSCELTEIVSGEPPCGVCPECGVDYDSASKYFYVRSEK